MHSHGPNVSREPLLRESIGRQSLTSRISIRVARSLSVIGVAEEPRNGSVAGAAINTLCNVVGAGVLSLPLAMYEASIVGALVLMLCTALLAGFAAFAVIAGCDMTQRFSFTEVMAFTIFPPMTFENFCAQESSVPPGDHFEVEKGTMEMEGLRGRYTESELKRRKRRRIVTVLVEAIIFLGNYGTLIIYSRVIADSIPPVVESFLHGSGVVVTRFFWLLVSGIVFFFLSCVRNMDELKWTSMMGFLTIFYIVLTAVARYFTSRRTPPYPKVDPVARGEINWYHVGTGLFRTMSTYGVAFDYHYNVPYFYKELRDRTLPNMMKSVYIAFPIIVCCYIATGVFGYLTFGDIVADDASGGDIVRIYPEDDPVVNVGRLGLFFHFACVYPILSVGARRGLHRLIMNALMWASQTERVELGGQLGEVSYSGQEGVAGDTSDSVFGVNADRDVGSPEDTTRLAIVLEALFIVSTTLLLAAVIPGISVAINILGSLFGTFLMLTGPGLIAWFLFSRTPLVGTSPYRFVRLLMGLSVLLIVSGVFFSVVGITFLIKKYTT
ncbi:putative amino acid permease-like protein [Trypanosoma conorhini]|uniref:Putative amino acid permease-like protein n=1 Tax=Trypanosoma conorhini TaxID=83891 RepID=A0A422P7V8_9TRYP|nr:putative amino acid permease-like protein [Trypanosoma conorhini]RNF13797.1 putative amino acid permease-like protein [Trypanosoma conorhini]